MYVCFKLLGPEIAAITTEMVSLGAAVSEYVPEVCLLAVKFHCSSVTDTHTYVYLYQILGK